MPRVQRSVLWVCLLMAAAGPAQAGTDPNSQMTDPRFVLEQIQKRIAAIANYQCMEIQNSKKKHLAYSNQGCGRIRETNDNLEATSLIWNGAQTVKLQERVRPNGTVVYSASILPGEHPEVGRGNVPWVFLDGSLSGMLAKALRGDMTVDVTPTEEGYCRVLILHGISDGMAAVLDPKRGYLPVRLEFFAQGRRHRREEIEFKEVNSGVWFPNTVWTQYNERPPVARLKFTDVRINDPNFERLLAPDLPDGSTVADEVRGVRYVVDHAHGLTLADRAVASTSAGPLPTPGSEGIYRLDSNQVLKRIAPVSLAARSSLIDASDIAPEQVPEAALYNTIHVFQWDNSNHLTVSYTGNGFLMLSESLLHICGLGVGEFSGAEDLLELRLTGDWIVRRDATVTQRVRALERIVREETGLNVTFEHRRVDAPVVRATGIFQYHPLPGAWGENDVQLFTDRSIEERGARTGYGSGSLAQLLRHITNRTGRRFVDDTLSSDMNVSWSDYKSSELDPLRLAGTTYRYDLAQLLDHVAQQTGLKFTTERRTIDEWYVSVEP